MKSNTKDIDLRRKRKKMKKRLIKKLRREKRMRYIYNIPFIKVVSDLDDKLFLKIFKDNRTRVVKRFMLIVSRLGDGYIWIALWAGLTFFKIPYAPLYFARTITSVFFCVITFLYIKNFVSRQRPCSKHDKVPYMRPPDRHSFPSGHTMAAFAISFTVGTYSLRTALIFYPTALLVAYSRVFVGLHYPFDVIFGMAMGTIVGVLVNILFFYLTGLPIIGSIM